MYMYIYILNVHCTFSKGRVPPPLKGGDNSPQFTVYLSDTYRVQVHSPGSSYTYFFHTHTQQLLSSRPTSLPC